VQSNGKLIIHHNHNNTGEKVDEEESSEEEEYDEEQGTFKSQGRTQSMKDLNRQGAVDPRFTTNPVAKSLREKVTVPSKHISAADASNVTKMHKKQVTQELDKRAKYSHCEANVDKLSGPCLVIGSNHLEAAYVHHTLELSSCLCSTSVTLPRTELP
jgi:hypothetical protein